MAINRTTLLREPGKIIFDGAHLYSQGPLTVKPVINNASVVTAMHGTVDRGRVVDRLFTISGVLAGEWKDLAVLFHALNLPIGASVFGSTDKPLIVHGRLGTKITFTNGAITKPPVIIGGAGKTLFGAFEATCLIANNGNPATEAAYYTITSQAYPGDEAFDPTSLLTLPMDAVWGDTAPWNAFLTREGWTITSEVTLTPEIVDGVGTADMKVKDKQVSASCVPAGVTPAQVQSKLSFGQGMGARRQTGDDLVLSADGVYISLSDAVISDSALAFGDVPLVGETTWVASRAFNGDGTERPLLFVGDEAPEAP